jgi:opacity protein-like surface antigen
LAEEDYSVIMRKFIEVGKAAGTSVLVLIISLAFAALAHAQGPFHRRWEVSVFGGGSFAGDDTHDTPVAGSSQETSRRVGLRFASGYQVGGRVTENRWRHWGAAFEYSFSNQPVTFSNLSNDLSSVSFSNSVHSMTYQILYYPFDAWSRLRPYVFAGPALSLFQIDDSTAGIDLSDPWKMTMSWGGGLKYVHRDRVGIGLQFSDAVSGVPGYGLPTTAIESESQSVPGFRPDGFLHRWQVTLGLLYQWDDR